MILLIIDDSRTIRDFLRKMFESIFENIYECEDGSEALNAYCMYLPSYVFMDVQMKIMDGISATVELIKHFPEAKIIIISIFNGRTKEAAFKAGTIAYVNKENLIELFDIVR